MGPWSEDTGIYWASWLLGFLSLLLGEWVTGIKASGTFGTKDTRTHVNLKESQGGSVFFHVILKPGADSGLELEKISWSFGPESDYRVMLHVHNSSGPPTWVSLQDKYKQRVHVSNLTSLRIENLTLEDTGQYRAQVIFTEGRESMHTFHLIVYEPVPLPEIVVNSSLITPSWCNVTLGCKVTEATKDMNITWESKGLSKDLEQRRTPGQVTNSWNLAVSLPLIQHQTHLKASVTCVVNNSEDQKNATLDLGEFCANGKEMSELNTANHVGIILGVFVAVLMTLGAGLFLWKTSGKKMKMKTRRGPDLQEDGGGDDSDLQYADLRQQEIWKGKDKCVGEQHLAEKETLNTVYSVVHNPGQAMHII